MNVLLIGGGLVVTGVLFFLIGMAIGSAQIRHQEAQAQLRRRLDAIARGGSR